jgi:HD-like signal output (HDOD) protein
MTFLEAEEAVIGIDHAQLGAMAAEKWNFTPLLIDIIRNHHNPNRSTLDETAASIVYLADCICMMVGIGVGSDGLAYQYYQSALDLLNFSDADLVSSIVYFSEKMKEIEELVNMSGGVN